MTDHPNDVAPATTVATAHEGSDRRWPRAPYLLLSLAVLVLDQWSKWWVESHIQHYDRVEVVPNFLNFIHVRNTGVAFGLFAGLGPTTGVWILSGLGIAALIFVGVYFRQVPADQRMLLVALALVLGGAVGNLTDRISSGAVTDFIDVYVGTYHWYTFNVADSAITVGIVLMLLSSFVYREEPDDEDRPTVAGQGKAGSENGETP